MSAAPVLPEDISRLGLKGPHGALLTEVQPGGAGERAGLAPDDVLLSFDGQPLEGPQRLRWLASLAGVGATAKVHIVRGGRELDVQVVLGELAPAPDTP